MTRGCGGDSTLCLISNSVDGVCQCPAWMAKRTDQDGAGLNQESCISESARLLVVPYPWVNRSDVIQPIRMLY